MLLLWCLLLPRLLPRIRSRGQILPVLKHLHNLSNTNQDPHVQWPVLPLPTTPTRLPMGYTYYLLHPLEIKTGGPAHHRSATTVPRPRSKPHAPPPQKDLPMQGNTSQVPGPHHPPTHYLPTTHDTRPTNYYLLRTTTYLPTSHWTLPRAAEKK